MPAQIDRQAWAALVEQLMANHARGKKATFARMVGVDPRTVSRWIDADVAVSEESVREVARALDMSPVDLLVRVGFYREWEISHGLDPLKLPPLQLERDEEVEEIRRSNLPESIKRDLLEVLAEERERDKQRRLENMRRLIQAERRRAG